MLNEVCTVKLAIIFLAFGLSEMPMPDADDTPRWTANRRHAVALVAHRDWRWRPARDAGV